ncbi:hypothetical protein OHR68_00835 [Spirillospora sp. NBC_00431]
MEDKRPENPNPEEVDFASFISAVQSYDEDATEVRTTAHSSSVTTADWQQIQDSLKD